MIMTRKIMMRKNVLFILTKRRMSRFLLLLWISLFSPDVISGRTEIWRNQINYGWDYGRQRDWILSSPFCAGENQSPIDIQDVCTSDSNTTRLDRNLRLRFRDYQRTFPATITNNGYTAQVNLRDADRLNFWMPRVGGSAAGNSVYQFSQLHFHWHEVRSEIRHELVIVKCVWKRSFFDEIQFFVSYLVIFSQNDTDGSEHSLFGSREAVEMHFVHFNMKYRNMKEAVGKSDGLLVLAALFHSAPSVRRNSLALDPIIQSLKDIQNFNTTVPLMNGIVLQTLLPPNPHIFYRYSGSLTTPPCYEGVTWIVFAEKTLLSRNQFYQFDLLDNQKNDPMVKTNRDLQPINRRQVVVSSREHCRTSSSLFPH